MRVIIDTNVFISGLINAKGSPGKIVEAVLLGELTAVVSDYTFSELVTVLQRPRLAPYFERANIQIDKLIEDLESLLEFVTAQAVETDIRDIKDRPFIDLAASIPAPDFLITGDKDFEHNRYAGVRVISASLFIAEVL